MRAGYTEPAGHPLVGSAIVPPRSQPLFVCTLNYPAPVDKASACGHHIFDRSGHATTLKILMH